MRNKKRIPIILQIFKKGNNALFMQFLNTTNLELIHAIKSQINRIEKEWLKYPDLRFGQLLSNLGLVPRDIEDYIWNIEEDDWLIDNGYLNVEDIEFWGVIFYKNGKQRKKIKFVLLKDLKTDHIVNIIKFFEGRLDRMNTKYLEYFNKRINEK